MTSRATIRIAAALAAALACQAGFASTPPSRQRSKRAAAAKTPVPAAETKTAAKPAVSADGLAVNAVKFWSLGNSTRIAIEVSADFKYGKDHLDNPPRVFFDIAGAKPRIDGQPGHGQHVIPVGDKYVKQIRVAEPKAGTTRVVLDLEPGVECTASQLSSPDRLMIEVTAPGRPETPTVTPSVVVIKRFEPPPVTISRKAAPPAEVHFLDEPAPRIAMRAPRYSPLPAAKPQRRLLAAAAAPDPTPPPPPAVETAAAAIPAPEPITATAAPGGEPVTDGVPVPAKRNLSGDRTMARVFGLKIKRIIIDPGHGGKDEGTHGPSGLLEKDLVLDVAKRVGAILHERLGVEVVYTRSDDTFIPLERRTAFANDHDGDLFVSIHANSSSVKSVSGVEIYYLSFSNSRVDLDTAARENAGSESSVHELQSLIEKAMLNDKLKESSELAGKVLQAMATPGAGAGKGVRSRGVRRAPFVVLIGAHMPSVLAEIGFISNPSDEAQMMKPAQRQKIAESLAKGIQDYALTYSRYQVAQEPTRAAAAAPPHPATTTAESRP